MENRFELARRIKQRKPADLLQTLKEFKPALPKGIEVIESREKNGLGECLVTRLCIADPLLGQRQFIIRTRLSHGIQKTKLGPHEKFEELDDFNGSPLFLQDMIEGQQALIDLLEAPHEEPSEAKVPLPGKPIKDESKWVRFRTGDSIVNRSTLKRHSEQFPNILRKGDRGEWLVIRSHASDYIGE